MYIVFPCYLDLLTPSSVSPLPAVFYKHVCCGSDELPESLKILSRVCYFHVVLARSDKNAMNRKAMINKNNEIMSMVMFD